MTMKGNVLIAQGGGPTAVINQSLAGIVREVRRLSPGSRIYGALHGVEGVAKEEFVDLTQVTEANLEAVAATPSAALGSTRVKPKADFCKKMFAVMKAHDIRYFFYIGGNDSTDALLIISEEAAREKYPLKAIHVPKTIDNDLLVTDHTPGYASAARFVAQAFAGLTLDMRALGGVYVGIVMGRHAGFLTAAAAAARRYEGDGPHLVYLPERSFSLESFLADVRRVHEQCGFCVVAVSEGICDASGQPLLLSLVDDVERDAHGNATLSGTGALGDCLSKKLKEGLGISRVRCDTFGYLQRSFLGCVSPVDAAEAREAGEKAVQFAAFGQEMNGSVTIHRVGDYATAYRLTPLVELAGKTRYMPDSFINEAGNDITPAFLEYVRPLLGKDCPMAARLEAPRIAGRC